MNVWSELEGVAVEAVEAALKTKTGAALPGAPAVTATVAKIGATTINYGQLVKAIEGVEAVPLADLKAMITAIEAGKPGDVIDPALDLTAKVAAIFADVGVPDAAAVEMGAVLLKDGFDLARSAGAFSGEGPFAPAPRSGPPITAGDWSHGSPKPQPVENPSGAIGGDWPQPDP